MARYSDRAKGERLLEMDTSEYRRLLVQVRDLLLGVADTRWGPRLQDWISELDDVVGNDIATLKHIRRTHASIAGMGSLGDIVICKDAGHRVPESEIEIDRLNVRLQEFVHLLFITTAPD